MKQGTENLNKNSFLNRQSHMQEAYLQYTCNNVNTPI